MISGSIETNMTFCNFIHKFSRRFSKALFFSLLKNFNTNIFNKSLVFNKLTSFPPSRILQKIRKSQSSVYFIFPTFANFWTFSTKILAQLILSIYPSFCFPVHLYLSTSHSISLPVFPLKRASIGQGRQSSKSASWFVCL